MRRCSTARAPAAPADAAGGDARVGELERVQDAPVERACHSDRARDSRGPADGQVAGAVDRKTRVCRERLAEHVGEQSLDQAPAVQRQRWWARDGAPCEVHLDLPPAARRWRRGRGRARARARVRPPARASRADRGHSPRARARAAALRPPARRSARRRRAQPAQSAPSADALAPSDVGRRSGARARCSRGTGRSADASPEACASRASPPRSPCPLALDRSRRTPQREPKQANSSTVSRSELTTARWSPRRRRSSIRLELDSLDASGLTAGSVAVVDSVAVEDSVAEVDSVPVDRVALSAEDDPPLLAVLVAAERLLALATSAGSCPDASCTYTTRNATTNSASARAATELRMRRARRCMAVRRRLASALTSSCSDVRTDALIARPAVCGGARAKLSRRTASSADRGHDDGCEHQQEPRLPGVGALAEGVGESEQPGERGEAVQPAPACYADASACVVGEAEHEEHPEGDDPGARPQRLVAADEGDRDVRRGSGAGSRRRAGVRPWTTSAASVASDSASCVTRRSGRWPASMRPPISRPTQTDRLDSSSAAMPAARLVIQYRCGPTAVASMSVDAWRCGRGRPIARGAEGPVTRRKGALEPMADPASEAAHGDTIGAVALASAAMRDRRFAANIGMATASLAALVTGCRSGCSALRAPASQRGDGWWKLPQHLTWYWQLARERRTTTCPVAIYDIDGFENSAAEVRRCTAKGKHVICYIDVGTAEDFRPDFDEFPKSVLGQVQRLAGRALAGHPPAERARADHDARAFRCAGKRASTRSSRTTSKAMRTGAAFR